MKTLKDMEFDLTDKVDDYTSSGVFSNELREEAIKWIKEMEKNKKDDKIKFQAGIDLFKTFFNITEEDLK